MARQSLRNIHKLIQVATNDAPIEKQFLLDLNAAIEKQDENEGRTPSLSYKPSSMTCIRQMFYHRTGVPQDGGRKSAILVGILQSGSARHEHLQDTISKMKDFGMDCEYVDVAQFVKSRKLNHLEIVSKQGLETKLYNKHLNISFLCDGILRYKGQYYILEIKTETQYKWSNREGVAEEHFAQGTAYSVSFGIDKVLFVYENRDNCDKKAYILEITNDMKYELVISKIETCDKYVKKLKVPPKPQEASPKFCQYCNYKKACNRAGR